MSLAQVGHVPSPGWLCPCKYLGPWDPFGGKISAPWDPWGVDLAPLALAAIPFGVIGNFSYLLMAAYKQSRSLQDQLEDELGI